MLFTSKTNTAIAKKMRSIPGLMQLSELELTRLLHNIRSMQTELSNILPRGDKAIEAVTTTQNLLSLWNGVLEKIVGVKRKKEMTALDTWDNEGGSMIGGVCY